MYSFALSLFYATLLFKNIDGANILLISDLQSPSHHIWSYSYAGGLINRGHNVTYLGPFANKEKATDKYHPLQIEVPPTDDYIVDHFAQTDFFSIVQVMYDYTLDSCNNSFRSSGFKTLMKYPEDYKFDLIIFDTTMVEVCLYPLIQRFNYPPAIGYTPFLLPPYISYLFGNDLQPSYVPLYLFDYEHMNLFQRTNNYVFTNLDYYLKQVYYKKKLVDFARQEFGEKMDSIEFLENHISLLLSNVNLAFNDPQPLSPNIIPVGGLHVKDGNKLPKDIQNIMDQSKNGVILFSLGSNIRSDKLNAETRNAILNAFSKINQTVLWKFESEYTNVPKNVIMRKWLPQNDILGHPNLKIFISHGGALSTFEALYKAVPVIGIPLFLDQLINVKRMVNKELALYIEFNSITTQNLLDAINEILRNPIYALNAKEISSRLRDEPQTPLERAVFWTEHAIRHNGSSFLNPKSRYLSPIVSSCTDVKLFLMSILLIILFLIYIALKYILSLLSVSKKDKLN